MENYSLASILKIAICHFFLLRAVFREDVKIWHSFRFSSIIPSRRRGSIIPLCSIMRSQILVSFNSFRTMLSL